jgi:pyruvate/2-oxoglutarate dehydrogenase complex dihydrolipoamide dehydrogenase (E3) component
LAEQLRDAKNYQFDVTVNSFNWAKLKENRDKYIERLNGIYATNLAKANITHLSGTASFVNANTVSVNGELYEAAKILITTGTKELKHMYDGVHELKCTLQEEDPQFQTFLGKSWVVYSVTFVPVI